MSNKVYDKIPDETQKFIDKFDRFLKFKKISDDAYYKMSESDQEKLYHEFMVSKFYKVR